MNTIFQVLIWITATIGLGTDTADTCTADVFATSQVCAATTSATPSADDRKKDDNPEINNGV